MTNATPEEGLWFQAIGRNADFIDLRTSDKGNSYARLTILIQPPMARSERKFWLVCFGETAEAVAEDIRKGDLVKVKGEIQRGKGRSGQWEEKFVLRAYERLAEAPQNDPAQVEEAMKSADFDDINF